MFFIHSVEGGYVPSFEYLSYYDDEAPKAGMALKFGADYLEKCSGTNKPAYISMCEKEDTFTSGIIPVIKVSPDIIFEVECAGDTSDLYLGAKVTIADDGLTVTDTTEGGVATVLHKDGNTVRVRFE